MGFSEGCRSTSQNNLKDTNRSHWRPAEAAFCCRLNPETPSERVTHGVSRSSATVGIPLLQASVDKMDWSTGSAHSTHQHGGHPGGGGGGGGDSPFISPRGNALTYGGTRHSGRIIDGDAMGRSAVGHLVEQMAEAKDVHSFHGLWGEEQTAQ